MIQTFEIYRIWYLYRDLTCETYAHNFREYPSIKNAREMHLIYQANRLGSHLLLTIPIASRRSIRRLATHNRLLQRLHNIVDEILLVLDTAANAHKIVKHTRCLALVLGNAHVRHRTRDLDERLDAAQRLCEREDLGGLAEALGRRVPALDAERQHATAHAVAVLLDCDGALRVRREAGVVDRDDVRGSFERGGNAGCVLGGFAGAQVQRLEASVREPAEGTAPMAFCRKERRSKSSGELKAAAPMTTSECPLMYFVTECTTMSAPWSSGFCTYGDMKVLSTTTMMPCWCAMDVTLRMSTRVRVGFDGDSIQMSLVLGRMSSAMSISMLGLNVTLTSCVSATFVK
jgi:hypothetical protein